MFNLLIVDPASPPAPCLFDEDADALPFGPTIREPTNRNRFVASDVASMLRRLGGQVIDVVSHHDGILITGATASNAVCYLLVCPTSPTTDLPDWMYAVHSLVELETYLQSL